MTNSTEILAKLRSLDPHHRFDALKQLTGGTLERDVRADVVRLAQDDKQGYNRLQALKALAPTWPATEVVRAFTGRLKDESYIVGSVIEMLGKIGDAQSFGMLSSLFQSTHVQALRVAILNALEHAPQQFLLEFAIRSNALNSKDEKVRAAVVALLGKQKNPTMRRIFVDKLKDPDARVRANAVEALGGVMQGVELARLVAPYAVADPSNRVRANSLILMLHAGIRKAQDFVIHMANHSDARWRASAAYAMRQSPPSPKLIPWAHQLAADPDEQVVAQAQLALESLQA